MGFRGRLFSLAMVWGSPLSISCGDRPDFGETKDAGASGSSSNSSTPGDGGASGNGGSGNGGSGDGGSGNGGNPGTGGASASGGPSSELDPPGGGSGGGAAGTAPASSSTSTGTDGQAGALGLGGNGGSGPTSAGGTGGVTGSESGAGGVAGSASAAGGAGGEAANAEECPPGFSGAACEINDDDCTADICENGGTCVDGVDSFVCECAPGFRGDTCGEAFAVCTADACQNGGACTDTDSGPSCECPDGFSGATCQINDNDCSPNPCQNGGTCEDGVNAYTCECLEGFSGDDCETNIDDCDPNPCENGGECEDEVDGYICECADGFSGDDCETNIDDCDPNPCENGGECSDGLNDYTCECDGYLGDNCEVPMFETVAAPGGYEYCYVGGISQDGTYMAVNCLMSFMYVFRWSRESGLVEVPWPTDVWTMTAQGISDDGSQIFGDASVDTASDDISKAFRWSASSGQVSFYQPYQANQGAQVYDVSADGSRLLGVQSGLQSGAQLLLWTSTTGTPTRYQPNSGDEQSRSARISGDGQVVIGISYDETTFAYDLVRWTGPTTRQPISVTVGTYVSVSDVNRDGSVAVGTSDGYTSQGWVWRAASGVAVLPTLGSGSCYPAGISDDGARIVGSCTDGTGSAAVMWENNEVERISTLLTDAGADLLGTPLTGVGGISPDGSTIVGGQGLAFWIGRLPD